MEPNRLVLKNTHSAHGKVSDKVFGTPIHGQYYKDVKNTINILSVQNTLSEIHSEFTVVLDVVLKNRTSSSKFYLA